MHLVVRYNPCGSQMMFLFIKNLQEFYKNFHKIYTTDCGLGAVWNHRIGCRARRVRWSGVAQASQAFVPADFSASEITRIYKNLQEFSQDRLKAQEARQTPGCLPHSLPQPARHAPGRPLAPFTSWLIHYWQTLFTRITRIYKNF